MGAHKEAEAEPGAMKTEAHSPGPFWDDFLDTHKDDNRFMNEKTRGNQ